MKKISRNITKVFSANLLFLRLAQKALTKKTKWKSILLSWLGTSDGIVQDYVQKRINDQVLKKALVVKSKSVFVNNPYISKPEQIERLVYRGRSRPLSLAIETTNICNNNCIICAYSSQTREHKTMSLRLFEKILEDYRDIGGGDLSLTPLVGEVLLDKFLIRRLEILKTKKYIRKLSVHSNGIMASLFDDRSLKFIVDSFDRFKISIYGLDQEEYYVMTKRNEYSKSVENVSRILNLSKGNVVLGFRHLKQRSPEFVEKWIEDLRSRSGCRYPIEVTEREIDFANWSVLKKESLPFQARWRENPPSIDQCIVPLLAFEVTSNGVLSFCSCANFDALEELTLGDLKISSIRKLYESERCKKLHSWSIFGTPTFCKTCSFYVPMSVIEHWPTMFDDPPLN